MTLHVAEAVVEPLLQLRCPRCEHLHADEYETIDSDVVGQMRCEACGTAFGFAVALCTRCEGETAFTWRASEPAPEYRGWRCARCQVPLDEHEANALRQRP